MSNVPQDIHLVVNRVAVPLTSLPFSLSLMMFSVNTHREDLTELFTQFGEDLVLVCLLSRYPEFLPLQ